MLIQEFWSEECHNDIHLDLIRKLEISSDTNSEWSKKKDSNISGQLMNHLSLMKGLSHKKNKRYSAQEVKELKQVLEMFPNHSTSIRNFLKIPPTSFRRLKRECLMNNNKSIESMHCSTSSIKLTEVEQVYISKLVTPPTYPQSISRV